MTASYLFKRVLTSILTLLGITIVVFLMIHLIPGNVVQVMLGTRTDVTHAQIEQLYRLYGINRPLWLQYVSWLRMLLQGNLGFSLRTGLPIGELIGQSFGVTAELAIGALLLAVLVAVPLGMFAALRCNTVWDYLARMLSLLGLSIPNFWLSTMLIMLTSLFAPALSSFTYVSFWSNPLQNVQNMAMPILALAVSLMAIITRMTRSSVMEILSLDHVRTATAKGLKRSRVVTRHVLRNSLMPIVTIIGMQMGYLLGGAIVVENVFSLPGMGRLIVSAINQRDYPLVQASVLFVGIIFVLVNLVVDISYALINPQIKY